MTTFFKWYQHHRFEYSREMKHMIVYSEWMERLETIKCDDYREAEAWLDEHYPGHRKVNWLRE